MNSLLSNRKIFLLAVALISLLLLAITSPHSNSNPSVPQSITPTLASGVLGTATQSGELTISAVPAKCQSYSGLPDKNCTPGEVDPNVTQENIASTICQSGYTKSIRPSAYYTDKLKVVQIKDYGYLDTNPKDYEEDHLISLELGGAPSDPRNLWPEPGASPNSKDKVENECHKKVCEGLITLSEAQKEIAGNWPTACR